VPMVRDHNGHREEHAVPDAHGAARIRAGCSKVADSRFAQAVKEPSVMMIFRKTIPRRTFLKGMGATLALPLLDAMVPAFAATVDTAAKTPTRLAFVYTPCGLIMNKWVPPTAGGNFEITPTLQPLAPFRDQMLVLTRLAHLQARQMGPEEGGG